MYKVPQTTVFQSQKMFSRPFVLMLKDHYNIGYESLQWGIQVKLIQSNAQGGSTSIPRCI